MPELVEHAHDRGVVPPPLHVVKVFDHLLHRRPHSGSFHIRLEVLVVHQSLKKIAEVRAPRQLLARVQRAPRRPRDTPLGAFPGRDSRPLHHPRPLRGDARGGKLNLAASRRRSPRSIPSAPRRRRGSLHLARGSLARLRVAALAVAHHVRGGASVRVRRGRVPPGSRSRGASVAPVREEPLDGSDGSRRGGAVQRRHRPGGVLVPAAAASRSFLRLALVVVVVVVLLLPSSKPLERPRPVHRRGYVGQREPVDALRRGRSSAPDQRVGDVEALAHDRRLAQGGQPELVDGVDLGSVSEEGLDGVHARHPRREVQRGVVGVIGRLDPRVPPHERAHRIRPVMGSGGVQRGATQGIIIVRVHAVRAEQVDDVGVASGGGEEEGRGAGLVTARERRALGEEALELFHDAEIARRENGIGPTLLQFHLLSPHVLRRRHLRSSAAPARLGVGASR